MNYLALDIGGANLKIADGKGFADSQFFPLWQKTEQLGEALRKLLTDAPPAETIAVTMTGELADCFATKVDGVNAILDAVEQAADGRHVLVYYCDGRLVGVAAARAEALLAAASNWRALGAYASRFCHGESGLLIDVGSTTTDIIPLGPEGPQAIGRTDTERLATGELVYTGVERSPVCALVRALPRRGKPCAVAQELFATTLDAYLLLGELAENSDDNQTADGRARTKANAHARLARMMCADVTMFSREDARRAAAAIRESQLVLLASATKQILDRAEVLPSTVIISGQGEFLARQLWRRIGFDARVVSLATELGPLVSRSACAHALATLAAERSAV